MAEVEACVGVDEGGFVAGLRDEYPQLCCRALDVVEDDGVTVAGRMCVMNRGHGDGVHEASEFERSVTVTEAMRMFWSGQFDHLTAGEFRHRFPLSDSGEGQSPTRMVSEVVQAVGGNGNAATLIAEALPDLKRTIEVRLLRYCNERDWQKLREWEMAQIAIEETAVAMTQLVLDLREPA